MEVKNNDRVIYINNLESSIDIWEREKQLLYQKNLTELSDVDLDKLGLICVDSFMEEKNRYVSAYSVLEENKKEYSEIENKENLSYDKFIENKLSIDEKYNTIMDHFNGAIQKSLKIFKNIKDLNNNKRKIKKYKQMKELKYNDLRAKINGIQISIIFFSTVITFFESIKSMVNIRGDFYELVPIVLSTYIGLAMAVSRFYKFDDRREALMKLDEKQSMVLSKITSRLNLLNKIIPVTRYSKQDDINTLLYDEFKKDGLEELITQISQEYDLNISYTEKIKYKEEWLELRKKDMDQHKESKRLTKYSLFNLLDIDKGIESKDNNTYENVELDNIEV